MKEDILKSRFVNMPQKTEKINPVSFDDVDGYFDASPVRILYGGMQASIKEREENLVYETVINMGVDVDKEKLLHALAYDRMQYYEGYNAGMKAISKWISVTERMPEDDLPEDSDVKAIKVFVAIKTKNGITIRTQLRHRRVLYDTRGEPFFDWEWRHSAGNVTHWMPLPEPPKEDNNANA